MSRRKLSFFTKSKAVRDRVLTALEFGASTERQLCYYRRVIFGAFPMSSLQPFVDSSYSCPQFFSGGPGSARDPWSDVHRSQSLVGALVANEYPWIFSSFWSPPFKTLVPNHLRELSWAVTCYFTSFHLTPVSISLSISNKTSKHNKRGQKKAGYAAR